MGTHLPALPPRLAARGRNIVGGSSTWAGMKSNPIAPERSSTDSGNRTEEGVASVTRRKLMAGEVEGK